VGPLKAFKKDYMKLKLPDHLDEIDDLYTGGPIPWEYILSPAFGRDTELIEQATKGITDPVAAYVHGFDTHFMAGIDGAKPTLPEIVELRAMRRAFMLTAPERLRGHSVINAFQLGELHDRLTWKMCDY
jgi:hypothetical protein